MDFKTRYKNLNEHQRSAVDLIDGPVMVVAGPGTGKTELLSMRAANILQQTDTLPENILCLTFTDSGANAMRERLLKIIGKDAYKVAIHTFHSFGSEVMSQNREFFYQGAEFHPADELSTYEIIRSIFDELDYKNPLSAKAGGEYIYLKDTLRTISELKKSGLSSEELIRILNENDYALDSFETQLAEVFSQKISKTTATELEPLVTIIRESEVESSIVAIRSLAKIIAESLQAAITDALDSNSTKPITSWRNTWMKKNDANAFVFKSRTKQEKLRAASDIYYTYLTRMQEASLYDFDDMILNVVHTIEQKPELKYNLQEKHQYIMVDEFQDTNMAQMRILHNLTDNHINEGRPNILVVGDDDQAIYSFQGADIGNIVGFRDIYPLATIIALTDNYRSAETILSHSRTIIQQGSDRLENRIASLDKTLRPHVESEDSSVTLIETDSVSDERLWLVSDVRRKIDSGVKADTITILGRKHSEIMELLPYLADADIAVNYERRDDVLELEVIQHIELLSRIIIALQKEDHDTANILLPRLLAHPAWNIDAIDTWKLSLSAKNSHTSWMEQMAVTPHFTALHLWLLETAQASASMPLERILDIIIGVPSLQTRTHANTELINNFTSPLFHYFFSKSKLDEQPDEYLTCLEALRTIRNKLREFHANEQPDLASFLAFISLHRQLGSTITSLRPAVEKIDNAINLMTAHKSKGLEFDHVYITGAVDTSWGERVRAPNRLIGYPENLPLAASGGSLDERIRLFFVGMTRAKQQLTISYALQDTNGKSLLPASFLTVSPWQAHHKTIEHTITTLENAAKLEWYQPLLSIENGAKEALLLPSLEKYKLSATHLGTFLDVTNGGPQEFLLESILRFPRAKSPQAAYGTAIHATLQRAHMHLLATERHRAIEDILKDFEKYLKEQHLPKDDFHTYSQKGVDSLQAFLEQKYIDFSSSQKPEIDFAADHVTIGSARITGKIDLIDLDVVAKTMVVTDYKTGKAVKSWNGKTEYEKIKLHRYRQQLMFYKLLVEHSRSYGNYSVERGVLQFVEPTHTGDIVALDASFSQSELDEFSALLQKVWQCITTLQFPDTSVYEQSYKGIVAFERDLLAA